MSTGVRQYGTRTGLVSVDDEIGLAAIIFVIVVAIIVAVVIVAVIVAVVVAISNYLHL